MDLLKIPSLSICAGSGGLDLAFEQWFEPIAYCEFDPYAQGTLISSMRSGKLPNAPIWDDLTTLRGGMLPPIGALYGGPPCQDFSFAGFGAGLGGERGRLMFETIRLIGECRPEFVVLENVPGLAVRGLDQVLLGLHALRYDARWTIVSAEEVGAPFLGERLFIVAKARRLGYGHVEQLLTFAGSEGRSFAGADRETLAAAVGVGWGQGRPEREQSWGAEAELHRSTLGSPSGARLERARIARETWAAFAKHRHSGPADWPHWLPKPALPRGDDGLLHRSHAIRCSGNGVVSLQAEEAFNRLLGIG